MQLWSYHYDHSFILLTQKFYTFVVIQHIVKFTNKKIKKTPNLLQLRVFFYLKDLRQPLSPSNIFDVFTSNFELKSLTLFVSLRYSFKSQIFIFVLIVFIMKTSYKNIFYVVSSSYYSYIITYSNKEVNTFLKKNKNFFSYIISQLTRTYLPSFPSSQI